MLLAAINVIQKAGAREEIDPQKRKNPIHSKQENDHRSSIHLGRGLVKHFKNDCLA
jgi:hypothetical protein